MDFDRREAGINSIFLLVMGGFYAFSSVNFGGGGEFCIFGGKKNGYGVGAQIGWDIIVTRIPNIVHYYEPPYPKGTGIINRLLLQP